MCLVTSSKAALPNASQRWDTKRDHRGHRMGMLDNKKRANSLKMAFSYLKQYVVENDLYTDRARAWAIIVQRNVELP